MEAAGRQQRPTDAPLVSAVPGRTRACCSQAGGLWRARRCLTWRSAPSHLRASCPQASASTQRCVPARPQVRDAVLAYWRKKRAARGKPLLRRLQAPTSSSDTNPFNVFRCGAARAFAGLCQSRRAASVSATRY